jgi:CheY-like chemotaxis protein
VVDASKPLSSSREDASTVEARSVLYVEDDEDVREMMTSFLDAAAFVVTSAPNAGTGLERLRARHFQLVITDQMLPDVTGGTMLLQAQAEGLLPNETHAVIVTANMLPGGIARPVGVRVFQKPLEIDQFLRALEELLVA